jgi:hypothetical protein
MFQVEENSLDRSIREMFSSKESGGGGGGG